MAFTASWRLAQNLREKLLHREPRFLVGLFLVGEAGLGDAVLRAFTGMNSFFASAIARAGGCT